MALLSKAATWAALAFLGGISLGRAQVSLTVEKNPSPGETVSYRLRNQGEQAVQPILAYYVQGALSDQINPSPIPPKQEEKLSITLHHDAKGAFCTVVQCQIQDADRNPVIGVWEHQGGIGYLNPKTGASILLPPGTAPPPGYEVAFFDHPVPESGRAAFDASGGSAVLALDQELILCGKGEALPAGFVPTFQPTPTTILLTDNKNLRALFVLKIVAIDPAAQSGTKLNTEK